ncbi:MAG: hypothetical protein JWQ34_2350 [Mucilaginibacter sp.]|uniref:hypothetical protein n=1 Tax=Mucilaginibacter sp. TaxID=1882438 RepID=UPI00261D5CE7|nr:hypothetical protein [Mucilaginibacter sp.]MDB5004125.1 hypothetical protein [Mucilaginibacter sp.]
MKKYVIKMIALILFTSVAISSCSLEYRQQRMHRNDQNGRDNNGHDRDHRDDHHDNNHRN